MLMILFRFRIIILVIFFSFLKLYVLFGFIYMLRVMDVKLYIVICKENVKRIVLFDILYLDVI